MMVETKELVKSYRSRHLQVEALKGINLSVAKGELLCIKGRSGSGKTTLLNLLGGLDYPTSGSIYLEGRDTARLTAAQWAELRQAKIGIIFQNFQLLPYLTAFENIILPLKYTSLSLRQQKAKTHDIMDKLQLSHRVDFLTEDLSGGEAQRVAIARALVNQPELLLADEPTGELDNANALEIMHWLKSLHALENLTVIVVSHDELIFNIATRTMELREGRLLETPAPEGGRG